MSRSTPSSSGPGADVGVRRYPKKRRLVWLLPIAVALPIATTIIAVFVIRLGAEERSLPPTPAARNAAAPEAPARPPVAVGSPVSASPPAGAASRPAVAVKRHGPREATGANEKAPQPVGRTGGVGATPPEHTRPEVDAADAIAALRAEGETGGIAAFGIPGTDPPKPGIVVPDGFDLPEGFVRHYQVTDDGQQLAPILMLDPDYDLLDPAGNRVTPPGGVVPPELAPPGMPIQILQVPERRTRTTELPE